MHPLESGVPSVSQLVLVVCARLALVLMGMTVLVPQDVEAGLLYEALLSLQDQCSQEL